jgi:hypothetical protein
MPGPFEIVRSPGEQRENPTEIVDDLRHTRQQPNLARGIVWADILAAIAADEEARQRHLPEAA